MKKFLYLVVLLFISFIIILNSNEIIESIRFSFNLCINNLFPSFIPFMLLSNILIKYNFTEELSKIFKPLMKIFKVNNNSSFVFIMSIFSGTPSNSVFINNLLENNFIDVEDAKNCLNFCHFINPLFILGTIGHNFLGSKEIGLKILISHYISSIIIGLFNKRKDDYKTINNMYKQQENKSFFIVLKESINKTIENLLLILGIITFFIIITTILNQILNLNNNLKFIYGLIEMTQGLKYLSLSNLNIYLKTIISIFLISFGGISIHMQVFSILNNKKIRYLPYLISRLKHGILSILFFSFWYIIEINLTKII